MIPCIELEGLRLHVVDERQCVEAACSALAAGRGGWIVTPNLDHLRLIGRNRALRAAYARADLSVADGMPLVWACRLQRTPVPGRVAGSDLIWSLSRAAAERGLRVYFLGGEPGVAEATAAILAGRNAGLRVAGCFAPVPGFERRPGGIEEIAARVAAVRPDIVFVALGTPKQELLIDGLLRGPGWGPGRGLGREPGRDTGRDVAPPAWPAWWIGVGASFDFVSGRARRAPPWLRGLGLEWLHRLAHEPARLSRRYLVDGLPFAAALMARSTLRGWRSETCRT